MGALLAAEAGPLTSCIGATCGPFLAVMCCQCAGSGHVSTNYASRCVMLWLQAFTVVLAFVTSSSPWLTYPCEKLDAVGIKGRGVCECYEKPDRMACWSEQLIWRVEGSAFVVFVVLLIMTLSGCALGASHFYSVAKFMAVFLLGFVSLFMPNSFISVFGTFASFGSALFLIVQAVLLMDLAYTVNEKLHGKAESARRMRNTRVERAWKASMIVASAILLVASIVASAHLYKAAPTTTSKVVDVVAMAVSCLLLLISITAWCKHGNVLTSSVIMAYSMWLVFETCTMEPHGPVQPTWICLALAALCLASFAKGAKKIGLMDAEAPRIASEGSIEESVNSTEYAKQCIIHAAAAVYIAGVLAPQVGSFSFYVHIGAVVMTLVVYAWTLIAPMVLKNRDFGFA